MKDGLWPKFFAQNVSINLATIALRASLHGPALPRRLRGRAFGLEAELELLEAPLAALLAVFRAQQSEV
jgi:hypothetical protein